MPDGTLNIAMIGYAFMGRAHSQGWTNVTRHFDVPLQPRQSVIVGRDRDKVAAAARQLGWESHETDWRAAVERDDIDLVDVCTPGSSHAEIAIAALEAGKHVLCEKPLANTVEEAQAMADAAAKAAASGARAMVGFNYRRLPAATLARDMVAQGRLGEIRHVRAVYLQDFIRDPEVPMMWRLRAEDAGSGALGDIGAHIIDMSQYMLGDRLTEVTGLTRTFVEERPVSMGASSGLSGGPVGSEKEKVTVDDAALFLGRFGGGAIATYEATRFATGHKNGLRIELSGSKGALVFDLERLNELEFYDAELPAAEQGFNRILVTEPGHPYMAAWWPAGHIIGWEHSFSHEVRDFIHAIDASEDCEPTFADGLQIQQVLDAVTRSAGDGAWQHV